jgi:hypothetical protein
MFLGQPWHLYVALLIAVYAAVRLARRPEPVAPPEPVVHKAQFFGGPLDGRKEDITLDELPPFFMSPYLTDEQRDDMMHGLRTMPSIAYYVRIDDDSYFYKRDVTPDEIPNIQNNGGLPPNG